MIYLLKVYLLVVVVVFSVTLPIYLIVSISAFGLAKMRRILSFKTLTAKN